MYIFFMDLKKLIVLQKLEGLTVQNKCITWYFISSTSSTSQNKIANFVSKIRPKSKTTFFKFQILTWKPKFCQKSLSPLNLALNFGSLDDITSNFEKFYSLPHRPLCVFAILTAMNFLIWWILAFKKVQKFTKIQLQSL